MFSDRLFRWVFLGLVLPSSMAFAAERPSVEQILRAVFPAAEACRESLFLSPKQLQTIAEDSGVNGQRALATRFTLRVERQVVGWAYLDTHRVRTLPETLLVMINEEAQILRIEVVAFREPPDYLPPQRWYGQFESRVLDDDLELKAGIHSMTGATLSARAATDAVRRVLAVHAVVQRGIQ